MNPRIRGVIVPTLTPFDDDGVVDLRALERLVEFLIGRRVHAIMVGGTTGEGPLLTSEERRRLAETAIDAARGRVPVIVHSGAITTREAVELTQHAAQTGATAAALVTPFYFHYSEDALFAYFGAVAAAVPDLPIYLYNNPAVTGNVITFRLVERLVDAYPNVVGLKDSSGNLDLLNQANALRSGSFSAAVGTDAMVLASLASGLEACVSGNANVVPELVVSLYEAASGGDLAAAQRLQSRLNAVRRILRDGLDLSLFKGILGRRGLPLGSVRAPLVQAPESDIAASWHALNALGLELSPA